MSVVYTYLVMDILHIGHTRMLERARELAGEEGQLIAGILTDDAAMEKKPRPVLRFEVRAEIARAIKYIDRVVTQTTYLPFCNVEWIRPDILIESSSHRDEDVKRAQRLMRQLGGRVVVVPYLEGISSSALKEKIRASPRHNCS